MYFYGITALARSGKDTFADFLVEASNNKLKKYALAQPIKDIICALFGWDIRHKEGALKEVDVFVEVSSKNVNIAFELLEHYGLLKYGMSITGILRCLEIDPFAPIPQIISPRKAFQLFGTEYARNQFSDTIWMDIAPKQNAIISDIRFENEADWLRKNNGTLFHLKRSDHVKISESKHASEQGVAKGLHDITITNDGTLAELKEHAFEVYRQLTKQ